MQENLIDWEDNYKLRRIQELKREIDSELRNQY